MHSRKPGFAALLLDAARRAGRRRRDRRLLSAMSERELHDLGFGRSEIPRVLLDRARELPRR